MHLDQQLGVCHREGLLEPTDKLVAVVGLEFVPAAHAVGTAGDGDEIAAGTEGFHLRVETDGLGVGHLFVLVAVDEEVGREVAAEVGGGGSGAQDGAGGVVEFGEAEEGFHGGAEFGAVIDLKNEIVGCIDGDDGGDSGVAPSAGADEGDEVAASGFADDGDTFGVGLEFGGVGADPADGGLDVLDTGGVAVGGREAVVDGEPGEASLAEGVKERFDVAGFVATHEATAVDEDTGGEGAGAIGCEGVEGEAEAAGAGEFEVSAKGGVGGGGEQEQGEERVHGEEFGGSATEGKGVRARIGKAGLPATAGRD